MEGSLPLHVQPVITNAQNAEEVDTSSNQTYDKTVVRCSSSSFLLGLVQQQTILLSVTLSELGASIAASLEKVYFLSCL